MGCLSSQEDSSDEKENTKTLQLAPHITMSTYDPGNMSITRESVMKNYQFTKKQSTKNNGFRLKLVQETPNGKVKFKTRPSTEHETDIEEHNKRYVIEKDLTELYDTNLLNDAIPKPRKRIVFISIVQLNSCIDNVPLYILEESLFMFKAQRAWFFPSNSEEEKQSKQSIRHRVNWNEQFLSHLQKKDVQGHVLWFEDGQSWQDISLKLTTINDIYFIETDRYYKPLLLNEEWWTNNFENNIDNIQSLHCQLSHIIIEEINACKLKFNPTMEIIYQSNPTLIPMKSFDFETYINQHYKYNKGLHNDKSIIIPQPNHCNQNSTSCINESDEKSNKNLVENNENISKKKYDMRTLNTVDSNTNTNVNITGIQIINQYSITVGPTNSLPNTPLDERKSNEEDYETVLNE